MRYISFYYNLYSLLKCLYFPLFYPFHCCRGGTHCQIWSAIVKHRATLHRKSQRPDQ